MRLDVFLVQSGLVRSRQRAGELVKSGGVLVNGKAVKKPAFAVADDDDVRLTRQDFSYVGRGGLKLEAALKEFGVNVKGKVCVDIGAATGGFTDCLLRHGAAKVYAVDIGEGQLDAALQDDRRVVYRNETDARFLGVGDFPEPIDVMVVDVSFLSVTALLDTFQGFAVHDGAPASAKKAPVFIVLVKPQFETGKRHGGVLRDEKLVEKTLKKVKTAFEKKGLCVEKEMESPITGKEGNREFLWLVKKLTKF